MKKTVLAFAVAAAMGVPALAAADTTLYGRFHVSVDRTDDGAKTATEMQNRVSRIGIRGSEDLGGGLSGVFQLEMSMNPVQSDEINGNRNSFVGLRGDFGQATLGRVDAPYESVLGPVQVMGDTPLDVRSIISAGTTLSPRFRAENSVNYVSPNFSGLQVMAQYGVGTAGKDNDDNSYSLGAQYRLGDIYAFAAYSKRNAKTGDDEATGVVAGGTYSIDDLRLGVVLERAEDATNSRNAWLVNARYNIGQAYLAATYAKAGDFDGTDTGATQYGIGAGYNFSRRTGAYVAYGKVDNDNAGTRYSVDGISSGPAAPGGDQSIFSIGVHHNF